jgi:predicted metal-dependent hydrolase
MAPPDASLPAAAPLTEDRRAATFPGVETDALPFPHHLRHSARARRTRVVVRGGRVELVVPKGACLQLAERFLRSQADWVRRRLAAQAAARAALLPPPGVLRLLGEDLTVRIEPAISRRTPALVLRSGGELLVRVAGACPRRAERAVREWVIRLAQAHFTARVAHWAARLEVTPGAITVRGQRARWGSCAASGDLSFNWRALLTSPAAVDYLVVHECAHLRHLNHGRRYWALVRRHCPDFARYRQELRQAGFLLEGDGLRLGDPAAAP